MNKKAYKQPSLKVAHLDNTDIICSSIKSFSLNENEVEDYDNYEHKIDTRDVWGTQW